MKRIMMAIAAGVCATFIVAVGLAQDHEDFKAWMKEVSSNFASLRKTVAAKDGPGTAAAADKLAPIFEKVKEHFEEHRMADAIDFAKNGHDAAMGLSASAKSGDWDKASADLKTLGSTCQGCHAAHRERLPDGSFKMK